MKYIPLGILFAIALMIIAGVVVDGAGKLNAAQDALTIAQGASRAGTNAATGTAINGDAFNLSAPAAITAADNFIAESGTTGSAQLENNQVVVTVHKNYSTIFLRIIGIDTLTANATASATLVDQN